MTLSRLTAFADTPMGGNPAGVWIGDALPSPDDMQRIAAEVGYSETAFAAPVGEGAFRVRYFAPEMEVPFCGHATIALTAALGAAYGAGEMRLNLNDASIAVTASPDGAHWASELTSPPTRHAAPGRDMLRGAMDLLALQPVDLATDLPPVHAHAGADHLILPLASRARLAEMSYDLAAGAAFMRAQGLVTIALIFVDESGVIHARNAFASGGVLEDPATGAAAAALTGWLRDTGRRVGPIQIHQGDDMGRPSRITAYADGATGSGVRVRGQTRTLEAD
ncbi:MAG: PhzF family phenazine biosynthesis protein [Pseudomonadota bacterium]